MTRAASQRRFIRLGPEQHVHAPVSLRLLKALLEADGAALGVMELVSKVYGAAAHPNARHSIDTLLRRIEKSGVQIERPSRGFCRLAEVSRETVVSILERQAGILALAGEATSPERIAALRALIEAEAPRLAQPTGRRRRAA